MAYKIEVNFLKSVYPYRKGDKWLIKEEQAKSLEKQWLVEVVVKKAPAKKPAKKATNKKMTAKSSKVSTK